MSIETKQMKKLRLIEGKDYNTALITSHISQFREYNACRRNMSDYKQAVKNNPQESRSAVRMPLHIPHYWAKNKDTLQYLFITSNYNETEIYFIKTREEYPRIIKPEKSKLWRIFSEIDLIKGFDKFWKEKPQEQINLGKYFTTEIDPFIINDFSYQKIRETFPHKNIKKIQHQFIFDLIGGGQFLEVIAEGMNFPHKENSIEELTDCKLQVFYYANPKYKLLELAPSDDKGWHSTELDNHPWTNNFTFQPFHRY